MGISILGATQLVGYWTILTNIIYIVILIIVENIRGIKQLKEEIFNTQVQVALLGIVAVTMVLGGEDILILHMVLCTIVIPMIRKKRRREKE